MAVMPLITGALYCMKLGLQVGFGFFRANGIMGYSKPGRLGNTQKQLVKVAQRAHQGLRFRVEPLNPEVYTLTIQAPSRKCAA